MLPFSSKRTTIYIMFMTNAMVNCVPGSVGNCSVDQEIPCVRFKVPTGTSMKMAVFWDVAPCSL
jgi:hypothetical protein